MTRNEMKVVQLINQLRKKEAYFRRNAVASLARLGEQAKMAVPAIIKVMKNDQDEDVRFWAAVALEKIRTNEEVVVQALVEVMRNDEAAKVRQAAIRTLRELGDSSEKVVASLIQILKEDKQKSVRVEAVLTLERIGGKEIVPVLIQALQEDPNSEVRELVIWALKEMGGKATAAVPTLIKTMKEEKRILHLVAFDALRNIARDLGYKNFKQFLQDFTKKEEGLPIMKGGQPLKKAIQLSDLPKNSRCMVCRLEIHPEMEEIVACPYCKRFAKKELLTKWLGENGTCPVCRRKLQIEGCLIVQLKLRTDSSKKDEVN